MSGILAGLIKPSAGRVEVGGQPLAEPREKSGIVLDITITRGYGSGDTATKVGAGAADFGVSDIGAVLTARARAKIPITTIASIYVYSPHSKPSNLSDWRSVGEQIGRSGPFFTAFLPRSRAMGRRMRQKLSSPGHRRNA